MTAPAPQETAGKVILTVVEARHVRTELVGEACVRLCLNGQEARTEPADGEEVYWGAQFTMSWDSALEGRTLQLELVGNDTEVPPLAVCGVDLQKRWTSYKWFDFHDADGARLASVALECTFVPKDHSAPRHRDPIEPPTPALSSPASVALSLGSRLDTPLIEYPPTETPIYTARSKSSYEDCASTEDEESEILGREARVRASTTPQRAHSEASSGIPLPHTAPTPIAPKDGVVQEQLNDVVAGLRHVYSTLPAGDSVLRQQIEMLLEKAGNAPKAPQKKPVTKRTTSQHSPAVSKPLRRSASSARTANTTGWRQVDSRVVMPTASSAAKAAGERHTVQQQRASAAMPRAVSKQRGRSPHDAVPRRGARSASQGGGLRRSDLRNVPTTAVPIPTAHSRCSSPTHSVPSTSGRSASPGWFPPPPMYQEGTAAAPSSPYSRSRVTRLQRPEKEKRQSISRVHSPPGEIRQKRPLIPLRQVGPLRPPSEAPAQQPAQPALLRYVDLHANPGASLASVQSAPAGGGFASRRRWDDEVVKQEKQPRQPSLSQAVPTTTPTLVKRFENANPQDSLQSVSSVRTAPGGGFKRVANRPNRTVSPYEKTERRPARRMKSVKRREAPVVPEEEVVEEVTELRFLAKGAGQRQRNVVVPVEREGQSVVTDFLPIAGVNRTRGQTDRERTRVLNALLSNQTKLISGCESELSFEDLEELVEG